MLMQLKLAGKLDGVLGIIFGEMRNCGRGAEDCALQQVIMRIVGDLRVPIAFGLKSGHVSSRSFTLPFGVLATLHVDTSVRLGFEAAVLPERAAVPIIAS
jgi:muramoyltetrapeptide carboxypeptidase